MKVHSLTQSELILFEISLASLFQDPFSHTLLKGQQMCILNDDWIPVSFL